MTSEAQLKANKKHMENLEQIRFWVNKGMKDRYKAHAKEQGKSLNAFIIELIEQDIKAKNG